jgi:cytochrome c oxidase cbb3-type subunit 2
LAVIQYVKYELAADRTDPSGPYYFFVDEPPGPPLQIGAPPPPAAEMVERGQAIWRQAKCWECHGDTGKGDGQKAPGLKDDFGFGIVPANLTRGLFKSGPTVTDIFRTISIGLGGTPMPSYQASFSEADRWALSYFVLSLSAFTDPLTGAPLPITAEARAALDDPALETVGPEQAFELAQPCVGAACATAHPAPASTAEATE